MSCIAVYDLVEAQPAGPPTWNEIWRAAMLGGAGAAMTLIQLLVGVKTAALSQPRLQGEPVKSYVSTRDLYHARLSGHILNSQTINRSSLMPFSSFFETVNSRNRQ